MIVIIISIGILCVVAVVLLLDIIPQLKDWVSRIHIGRFTDKSKWNVAITKTGLRWVNRTPKIKVTDNNRLTIIDMLQRNYSKRSIQHWQEASLILGLAEYLKYHDDQEVVTQLVNYVNKTFDHTGQWVNKPQHVDGAILAYSIMKLDFISTDQYKNALDYMWRLIQEHIGEDGTVKYRQSTSTYRYVDTVGFICPFLIVYGLTYNKDECIQLAIKQIKQYSTYGLSDKFFIPFHAYHVANGLPLGLFGWGRGLGWYAIGVIDAWTELPKGRYKEELEQLIIKYAKQILTFQNENGSWSWQVTRSDTRADSSTTGTLAWFLFNASQILDISSECIHGAEKAIQYLMSVTRRDGTVDFSQGDTKDIGVYSTLFNRLPFTQGFCIRTINAFINTKVE